jgi:TDG/mug DNA glycosylase family protein
LKIYSFDPVIQSNPRALILGSMPGKRSLEMQQYYAHPQNAFWCIMGELFGFAADLPYPQRLDRLTERGIALWDVLHSCERAGSLDTAIQMEVPNDLPGLLAGRLGIRLICCNGGKSWSAFHRHILPRLSAERLAALELRRLPSTSPANARLSYAQKLELWQSVLEDVI